LASSTIFISQVNQPSVKLFTDRGHNIPKPYPITFDEQVKYRDSTRARDERLQRKQLANAFPSLHAAIAQ
jgi:hypothetical protein